MFYVIVETNDEHFEVYSIDLNLDDPRVSKSYILRYEMKKVNEKPVTNFHVRGSPKKEGLNKIVMIFILHDNKLLSWKEGEPAPICKSEKASNYCYVSENEFYYMEEKSRRPAPWGKDYINSVINMVDCHYNTFDIKTIF